MRKTSQAEIILQGARERVRTAREEVEFMERKLDALTAALRAYEFSLEQLEKDLTPRKVKDPKSPAPSAKPRSSRKSGATDISVSSEMEQEGAGSAPKCGCGEAELEYVHSPANPDYHKFHAAIKMKAASV